MALRPDQDETLFYINTGTVQAYIARHTPFAMHHFGRAVYDRNEPILTPERRAKAQTIVDQLNAGTLTETQAVQQLNREAYY